MISSTDGIQNSRYIGNYYVYNDWNSPTSFNYAFNVPASAIGYFGGNIVTDPYWGGFEFGSN